MTAREQAIEAAAKAISEYPLVDAVDRAYAAAALAAAVPVLLNDLADRIGNQTEFGLYEYNEAIRNAAEVVRAAAEGWGQ